METLHAQTLEKRKKYKGKFGRHQDKIVADADFRIMTSLGDSTDGETKTMSFHEVDRNSGKTIRSVTLKCPHGTVIGLSTIVSGAVFNKYAKGTVPDDIPCIEHEVNNTGRTHALGMEVRIMEKGELEIME